MTIPLRDATFLVIDFETVTPAARPPEPIEVAVARIKAGLALDPTLEISWLIRPPEGAPITSFDTAQTGIRWEDVCNQPLVRPTLKRLDDMLGAEEAIFVAHNARYESGIIQRFVGDVPRLAARPFVDTIALARFVLPNVSDYKLDTLAQLFSLPIPPDRHRALPDVRVTARLFLKLISRMESTGKYLTVDQLRDIAGVKTQASLF